MLCLKYVLITPARNEEIHIEKTLRSVTSQTLLPEKWIIVNDGSTDNTEKIVTQYLAQNPWIELIRISEDEDRNFAAKVRAFNEGYKIINDVNYHIIGNLDADISFDNNYFEFLISKFKENEKLGVAGTPFTEDSFQGYNYNFANIEHVSGACQLFRRKCFEEIGGYMPIRGGGIDWVAVTTARMKGWKTRTFTEKVCFHHRKIGTGTSNVLKARFKLGKEDYYLGGHPVWAIFRAFFQLKQRPYIVGGFFLYLGYIWAFLTRVKRPLSEEILKFHRKEQMFRLKAILRKTFPLRSQT